MTLSERYGIIRSWLMYYAKPFNRSKLKSFYAQFVKENDLVFDIGAHLGNRSRAYLDLSAKVVAVEPQPLCANFLKKTFADHQDFTLLQVVVGSYVGEISFYISTQSPTISTARDLEWRRNINAYSAIPATWDQMILVPMITLDHMIQTYGMPVFCKIDTEGFEWEVISGLNVPLPNVSFEYLAFDRSRIIACLRKLQGLTTYKCNFSPGESQRWYWPNWKSMDEAIKLIEADQLPFRFGDLYVSMVDHGVVD
jgi:FkbM family methyltransferase